MAGDSVNPVDMLALEYQVQEVRESFQEQAVLSRPFPVYIPNRLINGTPAVAPTVSTASGSVTEERDYAFSLYSDEGDFETTLSSETAVDLVTAEALISGAGSADTRISDILLYTRITGADDLSWRLVAEIPNTGGTWNYTDNRSYGGYLGEPTPVTFAYPLQIVCGKGFRLRRVKFQSSRDYAADTSAYWRFWLEVRKNGTSVPILLVGRQDTTRVGLQAKRVYNLPMLHLRAEVPNRDLDLALNEDDRVYFVSRGVGAVSPLPNLLAMVEVTRETP